MVLDSALISIQLRGPLSASLATRTVTPNAAKQREDRGHPDSSDEAERGDPDEPA